MHGPMYAFTRPGDLAADARIVEAFAGQAHGPTVPGRADVDGRDPLSMVGPCGRTWRLVGHGAVAGGPGGSLLVVLRFDVDGRRTGAYAVATVRAGVLALDEATGRRVADQTREVAEARAVALTIEAARERVAVGAETGGGWRTVRPYASA